MEKIFQCVCSSPANLALIKYWGKRPGQYPQNPSLSITLSECSTRTQMEVFSHGGSAQASEVKYEFAGGEGVKRVQDYMGQIQDLCPELKKYSYHFKSENSFPHSAGMASSASAFSALAFCLAHFARSKDLVQVSNEEEFLSMASSWARIGSGSACRSLYGPWSLWGECENFPSSSQKYAIPLRNLNFFSLANHILIFSRDKKSLSSSLGHKTMENHPYALARYDRARTNLSKLIKSIREKNWSDFASVVEAEALDLHSLMMSAPEPYTLLLPETLEAIQLIQKKRKEKNIPLAFTLDAGPNLHILYPQEKSEQVRPLLDQLKENFNHIDILADQQGRGTCLVNA